MALKPISPAQARAQEREIMQQQRQMQQAARKQNMQQQQTSPKKPMQAIEPKKPMLGPNEFEQLYRQLGITGNPSSPKLGAKNQAMSPQEMDQRAMDSAKAQQAKPIAGPAPAPMQTGTPLSAGMSNAPMGNAPMGNTPMGNAPMATPAPMGAGAGMGQPATMIQPAPAMMRRGGSVKNKQTAKFSSGGSVSKASSRGDGIAQRGKTKGRMC
jgi:hypothetical protein